MTLPLTDCRIALAEGRQLDELTQMLAKEGATVLPYPMVSILDAPDPAPVVAWLRELVADRFGLVILLTGDGFRRLVGFAERDGFRDEAVAAFGRTRLLTRGPKPVRALKEVGLSPALVAAAPTTEGVIATLRQEPLRGVTVGVQLYSDANPPLTDFLAAAGATARTVLPYVYAPAADADRVAELIDRLAAGAVDVIVFTSSPQATRLYEVAADKGLEAPLRAGLERTCVAAVGPVIADSLREHGVRIDIVPEQGFVMKNLVNHIKRQWPARRAGG